MAVYMIRATGDASRVRRAATLAQQGRYDEALAEAGRVRGAPAEAAALVVRARALTGKRDPRADAAWAAVVRRVPNSWQLQLEWVRAILKLGGSRAHALRVYERARALNPQLPAFGPHG
jgi:hypothetical protein